MSEKVLYLGLKPKLQYASFMKVFTQIDLNTDKHTMYEKNLMDQQQCCSLLVKTTKVS